MRTIEAKKTLGGLLRRIWETHSVFLNTLGGIVLLGVEEYADKSLHSLDLPDSKGMAKEFQDAVNYLNKASDNILSDIGDGCNR